MGRKPKYATLRKYQPYIDVIMDDLGLTDKVEIDWVFGIWQRRGGDAQLYSGEPSKYDGKYQGRVRIDKRGSHAWTLEAIMHELKHIQQYVSGRLSWNVTWKSHVTKRGNYINVPYRKWDGKLTRQFKLMPDRKGMPNQDYLDNPWEVDARDYEQKENRLRLFPNDKLPVSVVVDTNKKILLGKVDGVTFYKIVS